MLKRLLLAVVTTLFFVIQFNIASANAVELDQDIRTVKLNDAGDEVVLSLKQVKEGQRLFVNKCTYCHKAGTTKTNPNVGLGLDALANAVPAKDNIEGIVEYLKHPVTYDGEVSLEELHPNTSRSDLYPMMRNLTDEDMKAIAGHILIQPEIRGTMWGGGKVYN
ncbi:MAG: photosystem II cytochrome c-550 [Xenococcaceae cyanobacterium MO_188.B32]|nr:photosystem II cytochrome c-550 [Xenococcaceae cyanobacterium MO_188.B32]